MKNIKYIFLSFSFLLLIKNAQAQDWQWSHQIGSSIWDFSNMAIDIYDNVYVSVSFQGSYCYFNSDTSGECEGDNDLLLIKYNKEGNLLWWKQFGTNNSGGCLESISGIVTDDLGNVILAGSFCGAINLGCSTLTATPDDLFIAKLDSNGNCIWSSLATSFLKVKCTGLALDDSSNLYICGTNTSSAVFESDTIPRGGFLAKYDSSGNLIWVKNKFRNYNLVNESELFPSDIKINKSNVLVTGNAFNDTIIVDTITIHTPQIISSSSICCLDLDGNVKWLKLFGGNYSGSGFRFSLDTAGNSYVTGGFLNTGYFGDDTLNANSQSDLFLSKIDSSGNFIWTKQVITNQLSFGYSSSVGQGDLGAYIAGYFSGNAYFDNYNINSTTAEDMFLARYDNSGNCLGVLHFGNAEGFRVSQDADGNPYVSGTFIDTVTIGSNTFISYSGNINDVFVAKCDAFTGTGEGGGERRINQLLIYANPNEGKCNITIPDEFKHEKKLTLSIFDSTGKLIQQGNVEMNEEKVRVNLEAEAKGIYNVTLSNGKKSYGGKIVFE